MLDAKAQERVEQAILQAAILAILRENPEGLTEEEIRDHINATLRHMIGLRDDDVITRRIDPKKIDPTVH